MLHGSYGWCHSVTLPTFPVSHQHFVFLSLPAIPIAHQIISSDSFCHTNFWDATPSMDVWEDMQSLILLFGTAWELFLDKLNSQSTPHSPQMFSEYEWPNLFVNCTYHDWNQWCAFSLAFANCHWFFQLEGIKLFQIILAHACLQVDVLCYMLVHHCLYSLCAWEMGSLLTGGLIWLRTEVIEEEGNW